VNRQRSYTPPEPDPPLGDTQTLSTYNFDRQLTELRRPDLDTIELAHDNKVRPAVGSSNPSPPGIGRRAPATPPS
jgi:hypothetical protein